jgi:Flp pilus assembly protein TadB
MDILIASLLAFLAAAGLLFVLVLLWTIWREARAARRRQERLERLLASLLQEKAIDLLRQLQGRIRDEQTLLLAARRLDPQGRGEALYRGVDQNFSTAIKILLEARRMYEERLGLLDRADGELEE